MNWITTTRRAQPGRGTHQRGLWRMARSLGGAVILPCTLAVLCGIAVPGLAEGAGEYGVHVAYSKAADSVEGNYLVGGHMELRPVPLLGLRGAVGYRSDERFQLGTLDAGHVRVRSVPITLSGKLYLPMTPVASPFLQAGAGWYRVHYDYPDVLQRATGLDDQSVTTFGWHLGAGMRVGIAPKVSLSGEAQYVFVDPDKKLDPEVRDQVRNLDYNTATFSVGLSLAL